MGKQKKYNIGDRIIADFSSGNYCGEIIGYCNNDGELLRYHVKLYGYSFGKSKSVTSHVIHKKYLKLDKQEFREKRLKKLLE